MGVIASFLKNTKLFYFSIFIVFGLIFLLHYSIAGQAVYGDGIEYYAWLHSAYFDHDINFSNELKHIYNNQYNNNFPNALTNNNPQVTSVGKVGNFHMPGMAILLLPFYFLADMVVIFLNFLGFHVLRNGYSDIYQIISGLGAVFYGILGIFISERLLGKIFVNINNRRHFVFRASVLTVVLASSLFYYLTIDVLNSHFAIFFVTSLFFYVLFTYKFNKIKLALLGFLIGLASLIRFQEAALFVPLIILLIYDYSKNINLKSLTFSFSITAIIFLIMVFPLFLAWQYLYGSIFSHPYLVGFANSKDISLFGSLIDSTNGLFTKTPFMLFLLLALPLTYKNFKKEFAIFFSFFIIQIFAIAQYGGWPAASYGARMYISSMFLFFLLASVLFTKVNKKLTFLIITCFVLVNFINIFNFMLFDKQASEGRSGLETETKIKIEKFLKTF